MQLFDKEFPARGFTTHVFSQVLKRRANLSNLNNSVYLPVIYTWEREMWGGWSDFPMFAQEDSCQTEFRSRAQSTNLSPAPATLPTTASSAGHKLGCKSKHKS